MGRIITASLAAVPLGTPPALAHALVDDTPAGVAEGTESDLSGLTVGSRTFRAYGGWSRNAEVHPMALPPGFDPTTHRVDDRVSRPPERSNWRRHGPYLRTLAVAIVLTAAAASAGMLMALMGD